MRREEFLAWAHDVGQGLLNGAGVFAWNTDKSYLLDLATEATPTETIEDLVARRELSHAVARAMALLPDEQRTAIILKEYHGLTFQEIADLLDCP